MTTYTLPRTGRAPIRFEGDKITMGATATGKREHSITIYMTQAGKFVARIQYLTEWPRETGRDTVFIAGAWPLLVEQLANYRAGDNVTGFPAGEQFRQQEEITKREVQDDYATLLSALFAELNWFEEIY